MMMNRSLLRLTRLLALLGVAAAAQDGGFAAEARAADEEKSYDIRLMRPDVVGEKFRVSGEGALIRHIVTTVGEERTEQPETGEGIKLEATAEVLGVTPKGRATKLAITVERCVRLTGPQESELLPKGAIVTAEGRRVNGVSGTSFSLKEGELPEGANDVLDLLFQLQTDDTRGTDDELFGTPDKQAVGATWPISADRAAKDYVSERIQVDPADITGTVKLEAVEPPPAAGKSERLKITGRMTVKKLLPDADTVAPDRPESGSLDFRFQVTAPVDPAEKSGEESFSARHQMIYTSIQPGGRTARTEVNVIRAAKMARTPLVNP